MARVYTILLAGMLLLPACGLRCGSPTIATKNASVARIINGTVDSSSTDAAIKMLFTLDPGKQAGACSGTLVAADRILTAAHCVPGLSEVSSSAKVYLVSDASSVQTLYNTGKVPSDWIAVSSWKVPPTLPDFQNLPQPNDIAIGRLAKPVSITPLAVAFNSLPNVNGQIREVGYGVSSDSNASTFGVQRTGTGTISQIFKDAQVDGYFEIVRTASSDRLPAEGDSGGPALIVKNGQLAVVGVFSSYSDTIAAYSSVDDSRDLIQNEIAASASTAGACAY